MKKLIFTALAVMSIASTTLASNPLMEAWNTPHQTPPFGEIKPEHFMPAVEAQLADARRGIDAIVNQRSVPTFENTIEALERNGAELSRTLGVFYNLNGSHTNPELQKIALELSPLLAQYSADVSLNEQLFAKIKHVYGMRGVLTLTREQERLLESTYKEFARSGANLSPEDKEKYRKITAELAELSVQFDQNELAATNAFTIHTTNAKDLKGLPAGLVDAAAHAAKEAGKEGYLITLHAPSYVPFMKYADNRTLREELWRARMTLCAADGANDNREIIRRIANLRLELANLLGYKTYADFALENRMAGSADKVNAFLGELLDKTIDAANTDLDAVRNYAYKNGFKKSETFMPWDFSYWNEKYSTATLNVNDEMTRPYFRLEDAEQALFLLANKLYGIKFKENKEIPVYHPDVLAYEVTDRDGKFLAVLYCDYFPRTSKNSGAWMNTFREAMIGRNGVEQRPIVVLVNNFPKPTPSNPSLLSLDEFSTMLHEFGHGLHGIFASGTYASQTGTNVKRDFVELPSQIMENWAYEKAYLDLFAKHYKTGEPMPAELIERVVAAKNYLAAYSNVNQLKYGMNDMAWHSITAPVVGDVVEFERSATAKTQILPTVAGTAMSPAFGHIFAGGYAAGYYSYKWAELLEANAFGKFKKEGIFDRGVAESFRKNILEGGDKEDPMTLFVRFYGSEPTIEPLIEKMGL